MNGKIVKSGNFDLALELEKKDMKVLNDERTITKRF